MFSTRHLILFFTLASAYFSSALTLGPFTFKNKDVDWEKAIKAIVRHLAGTPTDADKAVLTFDCKQVFKKLPAVTVDEKEFEDGGKITYKELDETLTNMGEPGQIKSLHFIFNFKEKSEHISNDPRFMADLIVSMARQAVSLRMAQCSSWVPSSRKVCIDEGLLLLTSTIVPVMRSCEDLAVNKHKTHIIGFSDPHMEQGRKNREALAAKEELAWYTNLSNGLAVCCVILTLLVIFMMFSRQQGECASCPGRDASDSA